MSRSRQPREGAEPFWGRRIRDGRALAWAPAKVNLFLEVIGKRDDGYHELQTLMLAVDLFDMLEIVNVDEPAIGLSCTEAGLELNENNLIVRAAQALAVRVDGDHGAMVRLTKKIPMQSGLGGGSSDAATTLLALNDLWSAKLDAAALAEVAAEVGSDVAFFQHPPVAWCTGRGEVVTPEKLGDALDIVIAKPDVGCSTADVYSKLSVPKHPISGDAIRRAVRRGNVDEIGRAMMNRLEEPALKVAPEIGDVLRALAIERPAGVQLTGSGSACFALCRDRREAIRVADTVRDVVPENNVFVVRSWPIC